MPIESLGIKWMFPGYCTLEWDALGPEYGGDTPHLTGPVGIAC